MALDFVDELHSRIDRTQSSALSFSYPTSRVWFCRYVRIDCVGTTCLELAGARLDCNAVYSVRQCSLELDVLGPETARFLEPLSLWLSDRRIRRHGFQLAPGPVAWLEPGPNSGLELLQVGLATHESMGKSSLSLRDTITTEIPP